MELGVEGGRVGRAAMIEILPSKGPAGEKPSAGPSE